MPQGLEVAIGKRLATDNPWWETGAIPGRLRALPHRFLFDTLMERIDASPADGGVVLIGPGQCGKTVLLIQAIQRLIAGRHDPAQALYLNAAAPLFAGRTLEDLVAAHRAAAPGTPLLVFVDALERRPDWRVALDALRTARPDIRLIAASASCGDASAFDATMPLHLPPLTFAEYLHFGGHEAMLAESAVDRASALDAAFIDYLNGGGFPETGMQPAGTAPLDGPAANDRLDRLLGTDRPARHGIQDTDELKRFFVLATAGIGRETSFEALAQAAGLAKNTVRKYLDYLTDAMLLRRVDRLDGDARPFVRATRFRLHLVNASLYAALFGPVVAADDIVGHLAPSALLDQWPAAGIAERPYYTATRRSGADLITLDPDGRVLAAAAFARDDRSATPPGLTALVTFARRNGIRTAEMLTRTRSGVETHETVRVHYTPAALACCIAPFDDGDTRIPALAELRGFS